MDGSRSVVMLRILAGFFHCHFSCSVVALDKPRLHAAREQALAGSAQGGRSQARRPASVPPALCRLESAGQCQLNMRVQNFLSKHGLAAHAELLDRQGLLDDLPWLLAFAYPHRARTQTIMHTCAYSVQGVSQWVNCYAPATAPLPPRYHPATTSRWRCGASSPEVRLHSRNINNNYSRVRVARGWRGNAAVRV